MAADRRTLVAGALIAGALVGAVLLRSGGPADLKILPASPVRPGGTLVVETVPRSDAPMSKGLSFRLDRRDGGDWVPAFDLHPLGVGGDAFGPPEGSRPEGLAVAVPIDALQTIRLPRLSAGDYRLRKWITVGGIDEDRKTVVVSARLTIRDG